MATFALEEPPLLLIDKDDVDRLAVRDRGSSMRDGITHAARWPLDDLPHEWLAVDFREVSTAQELVCYCDKLPAAGVFVSSDAARRVACAPRRTVAIVEGDVRRAALCALQCVATADAATADARNAYLAAKKAVDARSRSEAVADALTARLEELGRGGETVRVCDLGAGRLGLLRSFAAAARAAGLAKLDYVAVDADAALLLDGLGDWPAFAERDVETPPPLSRHRPVAAGLVQIAGVAVALTLVEGDALDVGDAYPPFDVVAANAFADLVRPEILADALARACRPGGCCYLPIVHAGATRLTGPSLDVAGLDDGEACAAYGLALVEVQGQHVDVDRLVEVVGRRGLSVAARGASDWVVSLGRAAPAADAAFGAFVCDFLGLGVPPRFFGTSNAAAAVDWARRLQAARTEPKARAVVASKTPGGNQTSRSNVDLLLAVEAEAGEPATRKERSHRRGDSLAQYLDSLEAEAAGPPGTGA